jgi:translocator protein
MIHKAVPRRATWMLHLALFLCSTVIAISVTLSSKNLHHGNIHSPSSLHRSILNKGTLCQQQLGRTTWTKKSSKSNFRLQAIPPSLWWILGHDILGAAPVPFISSATKRNGGWLSKIDRPPWNPPDWLFGPVWTFLYSCMGLAASKVYYSSHSIKIPLMLLWVVHFTLNLSWAPVFFSLKRFREAFIISCFMVLTLSMFLITLFCYNVSATAGFLLLPYLAWIIFATFLNKEICRLNPTVLGYNNGMLQSQIQKLQEDAAKYADS